MIFSFQTSQIPLSKSHITAVPQPTSVPNITLPCPPNASRPALRPRESHAAHPPKPNVAHNPHILSIAHLLLTVQTPQATKNTHLVPLFSASTNTLIQSPSSSRSSHTADCSATPTSTTKSSELSHTIDRSETGSPASCSTSHTAGQQSDSTDQVMSSDEESDDGGDLFARSYREGSRRV
jgi:hypothetical protein